MDNFEYKMELRLQRAIDAWLIHPWDNIDDSNNIPQEYCVVSANV